ncbi:DNA polymerase III subunit psi [Vibrio aphrogenes]|uniref:DNA polymerase III subunit psi n=1 Tax=Vibrio aphrogenes TaxID=1891186 RepID=UPI000B352071|nr:DNA polymerase III subunit psi [Vibrio aphrogenes]
MLDRQQQTYLKEMGITVWELAHPERLLGYQAPGIILPADCSLLLVADACPQGQDASLFIKVLASMKLQPQQALHLTPAQVTQLQKHALTWVWFAGCEAEMAETWQGVKQLTSPALADIHGNTQNRRDLWQQICSYNDLSA